MAKITSIHYLKMLGWKSMALKKTYKVEMIVDCRPDMLQHLLEEICDTAIYENARIQTYSSELINNEQEEARSN
jgi:hypothetical protein